MPVRTCSWCKEKLRVGRPWFELSIALKGVSEDSSGKRQKKGHQSPKSPILQRGRRLRLRRQRAHGGGVVVRCRACPSCPKRGEAALALLANVFEPADPVGHLRVARPGAFTPSPSASPAKPGSDPGESDSARDSVLRELLQSPSPSDPSDGESIGDGDTSESESLSPEIRALPCLRLRRPRSRAVEEEDEHGVRVYEDDG